MYSTWGFVMHRRAPARCSVFPTHHHTAYLTIHPSKHFIRCRIVVTVEQQMQAFPSNYLQLILGMLSDKLGNAVLLVFFHKSTQDFHYYYCYHCSHQQCIIILHYLEQTVSFRMIDSRGQEQFSLDVEYSQLPLTQLSEIK